MATFKHLTHEDISEIQTISRGRNTLLPIEIDISNTDERHLQASAKSSVMTSQLSAKIEGLSNEAKVELLALSWYGRADPKDTFENKLIDAKDTDLSDISTYLSGKPLHAYLEEGLRLLDQSP